MSENHLQIIGRVYASAGQAFGHVIGSSPKTDVIGRLPTFDCDVPQFAFESVGSSDEPQCLHLTASFRTGSAQNGHLR